MANKEPSPRVVHYVHNGRMVSQIAVCKVHVMSETKWDVTGRVVEVFWKGIDYVEPKNFVTLPKCQCLPTLDEAFKVFEKLRLKHLSQLKPIRRDSSPRVAASLPSPKPLGTQLRDCKSAVRELSSVLNQQSRDSKLK